MRKRLRICKALVLVLGLLTGCSQKMDEQPRFEPYEKNDFFTDTITWRHPVEGTVARDDLTLDPAKLTGKVDDQYVKSIPMTLTQEDVKRGQERYNIFCSMCHGYTGLANGIIIERGYLLPPKFSVDRLQPDKASDGYLFEVITKGHGGMPSYGEKIPMEDRWRIIAYLRVLQTSYKKVADLTDEQKKQLDAKKGANGK